MDHSYETARAEDKGDGLVLLTLNRPQVANAMNTQMGRDLLAFFDGVNADPLQHRCIVLTGAGDKAFCAGGDLKERLGMSDETWVAQHLLFERMIRALRECPEIGAGQCRPIDVDLPPGVLAYRADGPAGATAFLHNLGEQPSTVDLSSLAEEATGLDQPLADQDYPLDDLSKLQLGRYGYRWLRLH